jgi:lipopolysaccharide biosynthesis glycosyltransferase
MSSEVIIVCAADERFAMPLAMTLRSALLECSMPARAIVLSDGVSEKTRREIERACLSSASKPKIQWIDVEPGYLKDVPLGLAHLSRATYLRLAIGRLLPTEIDRVIYTDSDVLVVGDLAPFWNSDLEGNVIGAVPDFYSCLLRHNNALGYCFGELGVPRDQIMFNAGVLLMDLATYREQNIEEKCVAFLDRWRDEIRSADQDALNAVLCKSWKRVDYRWNFQVTGHWGYKWKPHVTDAEREQINTLKPAMLHFSGSHKPWNSGLRSPYCQRYVDCVKESGWFGALGFQIWKVRRMANCIRTKISDHIAGLRSPNPKQQIEELSTA